MSVKNSSDTIGNRTRDLLTCSAVPQTTALRRDYNVLMKNEIHNSYNQFLFHSFLSALHVSNESSRSSSGAGIIYCITQHIIYCITQHIIYCITQHIIYCIT